MTDPRHDDPRETGDADEPPPILGTWNRLYLVVLLNLVLLIALFYLFRKAFE